MTSRQMRRPYVDGNTVRKARPISQNRQLTADQRRRMKERQIAHADSEMNRRAQQERLRNKAVVIDLPYIVMLILASCCTLFICFNYIKLQTELNSRILAIEVKEQQLDKLKSENNALQGSIDTSINLDEIYRVATQELGMVYAGEDQVINYDKTESEYVRQYEDIPRN